MLYKELIRKRINEKKFINSEKKSNNWKKMIDSTNRLVSYMILTRTRTE